MRASGNVGLNYYTSQFETKTILPTRQDCIGQYSNDVANTFTDNLDGRLIFHKEKIAKDFNASLTLGARQYYTNMYDLSSNNPGPFNYPFVYNLYNYAGLAANFPRPVENRNEMEINSVYGLLIYRTKITCFWTFREPMTGPQHFALPTGAIFILQQV